MHLSEERRLSSSDAHRRSLMQRLLQIACEIPNVKDGTEDDAIRLPV